MESSQDVFSFTVTTIMPPRTRSNRAEKMEYQRLTALGVPVNVVGLPALPDELFLLIVSFFPTWRIPEETRDLPENGVAPRHKTLLVLTMTCRALRRVCLPLLWQRIEARGGMESVDNVIATHGGQHWTKKGITFLYDKGLAKEVLRQLETVTIREPKYATYVNVVDLDIMYSVESLLQELLNSLELFTRLHTIRLRTPSYLCGKDLRRVDEVVSSWQPRAPLTSIKRWFSSQRAQRLVRFCPNVHTAGGLHFEPLELAHLVMALEHPMEAVERLENVNLPFYLKMKDVAAKFPNLRHIGTIISTKSRLGPQSEYPPFRQTLAACQNLDSIEFRLYGRLWADDDSERNEVSAGPVAVLKGIQARDRRVKTFTLTEAPSGPTRRTYSLLLRLQGVPEWIESVVELSDSKYQDF